jgi:hypothetical protein
MVERMSLQALVVRRCRDYGYETPRQLAEATGMSKQNAWMVMSGRQIHAGIELRRALVKALDLDPDEIERSVRRGC